MSEYEYEQDVENAATVKQPAPEHSDPGAGTDPGTTEVPVSGGTVTVEPSARDDSAADGTGRDDSSQDPAQPAVGPAIQFEKLIVPDNEPVEEREDAPSELIDEVRAREAQAYEQPPDEPRQRDTVDDSLYLETYEHRLS